MEKHKSPKDDKEDPIIHHPQFVILDGTEELDIKSEGSEGQREYFEALNRLESRHYPFTLRLMLLLLSLGLTLVTLFLLFGTFMALLLGCITLFRNQANLDHLQKTWKWCKKLAVITLGVFVAIFSPPLGLGIILMYFALHGESVNQGLVGRLFRTTFRESGN